MPLRMDTPLPSIEGVDDWFNSPALKDADLAGHPVLIHFWALSCGICKESLPELNKWVDEYGSKGLKIISIHMPRMESNTNMPAIIACMKEWEMKQPCVVDNWHTITDRFENKYVPALYLFDAEHKMRHFQAGEKAVKMTEPVVQRVLGLAQSV
ncbi:MAG: TlpA family protein disulfide reductase [Candidatus Obscuribacter sp.]|nr:TlpA family protein disulfide reductase [Candidatus Obscuribacter sp.]